jgi:hypothetical protein
MATDRHPFHGSARAVKTDRRPSPPVGPGAVPAGSFGLRVTAAAGFAVDAYAHADLASSYPSGFLGEQNLFLVETGFAIGAALLVLTISRRGTYLVAALVAASALAAVVAYRYVDLGALGPLPDLYEPVWYPEKAVAAAGEAVALVATALLLVGTPSPPAGSGR